MTTTPAPRTLAGTALLGAATWASWRQLTRIHRLRTTIPPHLRTTQTLFPVPITGLRTTRWLRSALDSPSEVVAGVTHEIHRVPRRDGLGAIEVHTYERSDRDRGSGVLLHLHGGGFVGGSAAAGHAANSRRALDLGALVVAVDYRLAPENPFPAALHDCHDVVRWLHEHTEDLGFDPARVVVYGESAGGGLAACLTQLVHDEGEHPISHQVLSYPMLDDRTALRRRTHHAVWTWSSNRFGWASYLGGALGRGTPPPYAVAARRERLDGLPAAWIGVGGCDLFHAEDVAYAESLRAAGVECELVVAPGLHHAGDAVAAFADTAEVRAFSVSRDHALRRALDVPDP